jgi:hypothetical protein
MLDPGGGEGLDLHATILQTTVDAPETIRRGGLVHDYSPLYAPPLATRTDDVQELILHKQAGLNRQACALPLPTAREHSEIVL